MKVVDFTRAQVPEASALALACYERERCLVPALPFAEAVPDLGIYAENGLGAAAFEGGKMVGFLCGSLPFENAFGSTPVRGVFSPMGANGAVPENHGEIYAALYQAVGAKWVRAGAVSHALCLYAHDEEAQRQFYRYGFGVRCVDAVRPLEGLEPVPIEGYGFSRLSPAGLEEVYPLEVRLNRSYLNSPFFMNRKPPSREEFLKGCAAYGPVFYAARRRGEIAAYIRAQRDGETFIRDTPGYLHITGAYCLPEHRGKGLNRELIRLLMDELRVEGYTRLGVDFESLNPGAYKFWNKYFSAYTCGLVRRVDEGILGA